MLRDAAALAALAPRHKIGARCLAPCSSHHGNFTWLKRFMSASRLNLYTTIRSPRMFLAPERACSPATRLVAQPSPLPLLLGAALQPTQGRCCRQDKRLQESPLHTSLFQKDTDTETIKANL